MLDYWIGVVTNVLLSLAVLMMYDPKDRVTNAFAMLLIAGSSLILMKLPMDYEFFLGCCTPSLVVSLLTFVFTQHTHFGHIVRDATEAFLICMVPVSPLLLSRAIYWNFL